LANTPLLFSAALHASVPASSRDEEINGRLSPDRAVRSSWVATAVVLHASSRQEQQLSNKVYVGNLPFSATESDLRSLFEAHGAIESVNVITDRETGRARGFAFVEMQESGDAANAIRALDGSDMDGRSLRVNEAQDKRGGGGPRNRY
jgi:RNA recognition motif-containing protein